MHRGTTIEDAGYITGTSWPIVPDIKSAMDGKKYTQYTMLALIPLVPLAYLILMLAGLDLVPALIGPVVVLILASLIIFRLKKVTRELIMNCKMIKVIADLADEDVAHTGTIVFDAVSRAGDTERIAPLNDQFAVYVNKGYKMDDGRTELPYIIFIRKRGSAQDLAA